MDEHLPALPALMTAEEVAAALRVSPNTVYRWSQDGVLETIRLERTIRFRRADVEALLAKPPAERAS